MAQAAQSRKRWDTDDRFVGAAEARGFARGLEELAELARRPGWVAEEPGCTLSRTCGPPI